MIFFKPSQGPQRALNRIFGWGSPIAHLRQSAPDVEPIENFQNNLTTEKKRANKSSNSNCGPSGIPYFYESSLIGLSTWCPVCTALGNNMGFIIHRKCLQKKEKLTRQKLRRSILQVFLERLMGNTRHFFLMHIELLDLEFCFSYFIGIWWEIIICTWYKKQSFPACWKTIVCVSHIRHWNRHLH